MKLEHSIFLHQVTEIEACLFRPYAEYNRMAPTCLLVAISGLITQKRCQMCNTLTQFCSSDTTLIGSILAAGYGKPTCSSS